MAKYVKTDALYWCVTVPLLSIFGKVCRYTFLSKLISTSSGNLILDYLQGKGRANLDGSFIFAAKAFSFVKLFGNYNYFFWEIVLTVFLNVVFLSIVLSYLRKRAGLMSVAQFVIVSGDCVFLNAFSYNISKEPVQYAFFLLIFAIANSRRVLRTKMFFILLTLAIESAFFRRYYMIYAYFLVAGLFYALRIARRKKRRFSVYFIAMLLACVSLLAVSSIIVPDMYEELARNRVRLKTDGANTIILDYIHSYTPIGTFGNYVINLFRIAFPVELLLLSVKYLPFVIFQSYSIVTIARDKAAFNKNFLWLMLYSSFFLMSVTFEPDFGSVLRHMTVTWMFLLYALDNPKSNPLCKAVLRKRTL